MTAPTPNPKARSADLVVQPGGEETLIFDRRHRQAHCLNKTSSLVWRHCDGRRSIPDLITLVGNHLGVPVDETLVRLALEDLTRAKLMDVGVTLPPEPGQVTRRQLLRAGVAAVLLPIITSITADRVHRQLGGSLFAQSGSTSQTSTPSNSTTTTQARRHFRPHTKATTTSGT
jgi:hypothetical protein